MLIPFARQLQQLKMSFRRHEFTASVSLHSLRCLSRMQTLADSRYADPRHLNRFEHRVFSQHGEDGITREILRRIGATNRWCVEIGAGSGLENNTAFLVAQGWRALWLDGDATKVEAIRAGVPGTVRDRVTTVQAFATRENVSGLLARAEVPRECDILSLDVDLNTFWIWDGLRDWRPRVVIVEYNAVWPPGVDWTVKYDPTGVWDESDYFGASLTAYERLGRDLGYALVACDFAGVNAFFVRADCMGDHFLGPFDDATHYQPPSPHLQLPGRFGPSFAMLDGQSCGNHTAILAGGDS